MTEPVLETSALTSGYVAGVPIIRSLELAVADGGAVGVVGRNGAGKSCLARTLAGQIRPISGEIRLAGADLTKLTPRGRVRAGLALVPEGRRIFAQLTVRENLLTAAYGAGRALTPATLSAITERFPVLGRKLEDRAGAMSGGEQQWLAIARALIQRPRVIVLDEPSLGLSPVAVEVLVEALRDIRATGVALLLFEQNPRLLRGVCDVVHSMDRGVLKETRATARIASDDDLLDVLLGVQTR